MEMQNKKLMTGLRRRMRHLIGLHTCACGHESEVNKAIDYEFKTLDWLELEIDKSEALAVAEAGRKDMIDKSPG